MQLILNTLEGNIQGFPDTERKLMNVTRAWAKFISLDVYHVAFPAHTAEFMSDDEKRPYLWKEGIIPGEWLVGQIRDSCEWMPAPIVAREMYVGAGFKPADGLGLDRLPSVGRRRTEGPERSPIDFLDV